MGYDVMGGATYCYVTTRWELLFPAFEGSLYIPPPPSLSYPVSSPTPFITNQLSPIAFSTYSRCLVPSGSV